MDLNIVAHVNLALDLDDRYALIMCSGYLHFQLHPESLYSSRRAGAPNRSVSGLSRANLVKSRDKETIALRSDK